VKRIEAIVRPESVPEVMGALRSLGHNGLTVVDARGQGNQGGVTQQWRGDEYTVELLPKTAVILVVHDHEVSDCLDVIASCARTGRMGDGKIFVTPVEDAVRVRTGESGCQAL
jgi:nitrogen regulatory protein P-II 1